jgi:4,4'-diaponeurosporenoate glycosyltransferase
VRAAAMEDVALAALYRRAGLPVTLFAGGGAVRFRMHDGGFRSILEGWTRSLGDGARHARLPTVVLVALWLSGVVSAPLTAIERPWLGLVLTVAYALELAWLGRRIGRFPVLSWLAFPVGAAFFVLVFLRSAARAVTRRTVTWKGRSLRA